MCGYIKLNKDFLTKLIDKPKAKLVYLCLVENAQMQDFQNGKITLHKGEVMMTQKQICEQTSLSRQEVRETLKHLAKIQIIKINNQANNQKTTKETTKLTTKETPILTICDYDCCDNFITTNNQANNQANNQKTTKETTKEIIQRNDDFINNYEPINYDFDLDEENGNFGENFEDFLKSEILQKIKEKNEKEKNKEKENPPLYTPYKEKENKKEKERKETREKRACEKTELFDDFFALKNQDKKNSSLETKKNEMEITLSTDLKNQKEKEKNSEKKEKEILPSATTQEKPTKRFVKPTIEEIRDYCTERKNNINAEAFWNFYESKGWVVGKSPMKNWKAAVRTWEQKRKEQNNTQEKPKTLMQRTAEKLKEQGLLWKINY